MSEWTHAAEILDRAKQLIVEKGWQQGAIEPGQDKCLTTAIEEALFDSQFSIVDFNYAREALSRHLGIPREPTEVQQGLSVPYWGQSLMKWNDAPERKEEDVLNAIQGAANLARDLDPGKFEGIPSSRSKTVA